ncbi:MAG: hypothetical protein M3O70_15165 [Actinomycetota bacterium]|nr:hypothetical protein [Actinomycetota bacterium]
MTESAEVGAEFDLDAFLAKPLVAHIATQGPTIRPVWFLCRATWKAGECEAFAGFRQREGT